ncbi:unnamed protein product [Caenorhabditis brenneri]
MILHPRKVRNQQFGEELLWSTSLELGGDSKPQNPGPRPHPHPGPRLRNPMKRQLGERLFCQLTVDVVNQVEKIGRANQLPLDLVKNLKKLGA